MTHQRREADGAPGTGDYLGSKLIHYTATLLETVEAFADRLCLQVACKFDQYRDNVRTCLELSDCLTDDVFVGLCQSLVEIVAIGFFTTAQESFGHAVQDLRRSLRETMTSHWTLQERAFGDYSPRFGHWMDVVLDVHDLFRDHSEQVEDLSQLLRTRMDQISGISFVLVCSALRSFGRRSREDVKGTAVALLGDCLKELKENFIKEIVKLCKSMQSLAVETWSYV